MVCFRSVPALITASLCFVAISATAGGDDSTAFRVTDYIPDRFTDFEWRLDGAVDLGHNLDRNDTVFYPHTYRDERHRYTEEVGNYDLNLRSDWKYRYETDPRFWDIAFRLQGLLGYDTNEDGSTSYDTLGGYYTTTARVTAESHSLGVGFTGEMRNYLFSEFCISGVLAWDFSYGGGYTNRDYVTRFLVYNETSNSNRYYHSASASEVRSVGREFDMKGEVLLGWGRTYEGRYAATALFMVEELRSKGLLLSEPSKDHLLLLAEMVHRYRVGYRIDERDHRAEALAAVLGHLRDRGYIMPDQASALAAVEDVWDYFPTAGRRFGYCVRFGFGGRDSYESYQSDTEATGYIFETRTYRDSTSLTDTLRNDNGADRDSWHDSDFQALDYFVVTVEHHLPLALRWQWDIIGRARSYVNKPLELEADYRWPYTWWRNWRELDMEASLRYLHDARTEVVVTATVSGFWKEYEMGHPTGHPFHPDWTVDRPEERDLSAGLGARIDYRISVPTVLQIRWSYEKTWYDRWEERLAVNQESGGFNLQAGLTHWLY